MAAKTWGPFTGAQLTMMFLAVTALALPDRLLAVATSAVSITDAANGHTAAVATDRRLFVTDTLMEQSATPGTFFHAAKHGIGGDSQCNALASPPSGKAIVATDVRIDVSENTAPGFGAAVLVYSGTTCATLIGVVNPPTIGHFVVPFGPGFATKTGFSVVFGSGLTGEVYLDGYLVPAVQVPTGSGVTS